jgi:hypothetical protein
MHICFIRMVVTIAVKSIPTYLLNSAFAKAIEDDDDTIDLPESCFKSDLTIKSNTDLSLLLGTLRFWGVDIMPREVVMYVIWMKPQEIIQSTDDYIRELQYLPFLQALCAKAALGCCASTSDYWGYDRKLIWSPDPAEAAAQICHIHYEHANGKIWTADTTALAARLGQHHALKFLHENGCPWGESTCSSAASRGHLSCLQYAHKEGCRWDANTCTEAAHNSHLSCLEYACEHGCPVDAETLGWAIWHTPCYKLLCDKGLLVLDAKLCASAARTSNLTLLKRLHSQGCPWDKSTCENAAQAGSLKCLQYAHENGCPWDSKTCGDAAYHAGLACLQYAAEHGCPLPADVMVRAVLHLRSLQYLHGKGVPWRKEVCEQAAYFGRTDSLAFAHKNGCPWDARTCESAAKWGELHCLKYAHEHDCPWDARTVNAAAQHGKASCLKYALTHGCLADHTTCTRAATGGLACLVLAHEHGCIWNSSTCAAAATGGKLECLQFLFEHECSWDAATTHAAVAAGTLDCLKYAYERGCPWVVAQLLAIPLTVKSRRCLEYVREQAPEEAAAYDASILAQQDSHEQAGFAVRDYLTSQLSRVLNGPRATGACAAYSIEPQEGGSLGFTYTYTIKCSAGNGADEWPALVSLLHRSLNENSFPLHTGIRCTLHYTHAPTLCGSAEIKAAAWAPETKHQRFVRRWQEKRTRQVGARGQKAGKQTTVRKTGQGRC